jgi:surfeit locus 1 family protein
MNLKVMADLPEQVTRRSLRRIMRWPTLLVAVLVPVFVSLGQWQWSKGERKADAQSLRDTRGADAAVSLPPQAIAAGSDAALALHFRPVTLTGRFLPERQFLLDNRVHRDRAGYHVLTPFRADGSSAVVLVNRGWVPADADHRVRPAIDTPTGAMTLAGTAVLAPSRFYTLSKDGNTPEWTSGATPVWQTLDVDAFAKQSGLATHGVIVQLHADAPAGFVREWPRPDERIERHYSYALQWFGFAVATIGIWLWFLLRKVAP